MGEVSTRLAQLRLVPVIVLDDAGDAWPLAQALKAGGLPCAEVTLRTPAAEEALREMAKDPTSCSGPARCSGRTRWTSPSRLERGSS
jgi:2-keto-3-deoxy-6-phosphogluconate aldolase